LGFSPIGNLMRGIASGGYFPSSTTFPEDFTNLKLVKSHGLEENRAKTKKMTQEKKIGQFENVLHKFSTYSLVVKFLAFLPEHFSLMLLFHLHICCDYYK
jgi:hypothetical protein